LEGKWSTVVKDAAAGSRLMLVELEAIMHFFSIEL
jgi:hypothetical protein